MKKRMKSGAKKLISKAVDMQEVDDILPTLMKIRLEASEDENWGWEQPLPKFAKAMLCLHPQSYGFRIANRLSKDLNLSKSDDKDRGDVKSITGDYFEWKGSLFTSSNDLLNLVQIRPWQDTNYIYYVFDMRDLNNVQGQFFLLSKEQMELEMETCKTSSAHGTENSNANHDNIELVLRIEAGSDLYQRWVKDYGLTFEELFEKLNDKKS